MDPQTGSYSMPFVSAASVSTNGGNDIGGPRVDGIGDRLEGNCPPERLQGVHVNDLNTL
jgi:hypothetical protein